MKTENMIKELIAQGYVVNKPRVKLTLPSRVFDFLYSYKDRAQETMLLCTLNNQIEVINTHEVTVGLLAGTLVDNREIFKRALTDNASSIILSHNHPSGNLDPSPEDIDITERIICAGELMQIPLLDHVIISPSGFNSLRESTNLWR